MLDTILESLFTPLINSIIDQSDPDAVARRLDQYKTGM